MHEPQTTTCQVPPPQLPPWGPLCRYSAKQISLPVLAVLWLPSGTVEGQMAPVSLCHLAPQRAHQRSEVNSSQLRTLKEHILQIRKGLRDW